MAKTKIELFEDKLIEEGLTDEILQEYEKLLRRCGDDWNRIQHCFLTAYHLPVERLEESVKLIEFGNERYASDKFYLVHSCSMLGTVYMRAGLFQEAHDAYVKAYPGNGYRGNQFPWCLLETKMNADHFEYSPELEKYLGLCLEDSEFSKTFSDHSFMMAVAEYIIADHNGNSADKDVAYVNICKMLKPDYTGPLHELLKRHQYNECLRVSEECRLFLDKISND